MNDEVPPVWDQIVALPTWTLNNLMYPFLPEDHLFKRYKATPPLANWTKWRTPLHTLFDTAIWVSGSMLLVTLIAMFFKHIAQ
ncbi:MAG: hypothetical protein ACWGQW_05965 [bacterium]